MPVARYFLYVGSVLLALLFIADACLPALPSGRGDVPVPVIRIHSEHKWPERIVFDTSVPVLQATVVASATQAKPTQQTAAVSDRIRDAFAQLPKPVIVPVQAKQPKEPKQQVAHHRQKIVRQHVARQAPQRAPRQWQYQYAWNGSRIWW